MATVAAARTAGPRARFRSLRQLGVLLVDDPSDGVLQALQDAGADVLPNDSVGLTLPVIRESLEKDEQADLWHLNRINADRARQLGLSGRSVKIGILDTGVDADHPEFADITIDFRAFGRVVKSEADAIRRMDYETHGTHVSGIIAGRTFGLARGASLKVAAVLTDRDADNRPTGRLADVLKGFNWLVKPDSNGEMTPVINASLGFFGRYASLESRIAEALDANLALMVASIGNYGGEPPDNTTAPGNYQTVIGVGATDRNDAIASFSSSNHTKPDILAPGHPVLSAVPGGQA